jgi:death-on-curing protein
MDGDKRTARVAMRLLLAYAGRRPDLTEDQAFDLVIRIAASCSEIEVKEITAALDVAET